MMGPDVLNQRLFLAEGFNDTESAFDLLGRIILDRSVSGLVFENPLKLDDELMGDSALKRIDERACPMYPSIKDAHKPHFMKALDI